MMIVGVAAAGMACSTAKQGRLHEVGLDRDVEQRLEQRAGFLPSLDTLELNDEEREALEFLYAYMPVGDVGDYSVDFFVDNVRSALSTQKEMGYDTMVETSDFLHFVLPLRVNNEMLDTSRMVFYRELRDIVKGLSMEAAVKEVNHWAHQMAVYMPSDARTASPLSVMSTAGGRCGEQSVFVVAALRAVGIPARQIYVPRWSHVDDNHAWVEAWIDDQSGGKWHYLGACEPEAELNTGWFDASATRSPLMVTDVFGKYNTEHEVLSETECYTEINVTENYTAQSLGVVVVKDSDGETQSGAQVQFTIFNYGEFYPAVTKRTDAQGTATLLAGRGDMAVFASHDGRFAAGVLDFRQPSDTLQLTLQSLPTEPFEWDVIPASVSNVPSRITEEGRKINNERLALQNAARAAYVATFATKEYAEGVAQKIGVSSDRVFNLLHGARGNYREIEAFLVTLPKANVETALQLLEVLNVKDLRDTPSATLSDYLNGALPYVDSPHYVQYILNPRIFTETLVPYRAEFAQHTTGKTPQQIIEMVQKRVRVEDELNPNAVPISPLGVHKVGVADEKSQKAYLVAMLRSAGVAARVEATTNEVQYYDPATQEWCYAVEQGDRNLEMGSVKFSYTPTELNPDPKLGLNFTISMWNGRSYEKLNIGAEMLARMGVDMGAGATFSALFAEPVALAAGEYLLTTATRLANGTVLSRIEPFVVTRGETTQVEMVLREADNRLEIIDEINPETKYVPLGQKKAKTLMSQVGRGYYIVALIDAKAEPTTHMLRDLNKQKEVLEKWGRPIVLIFSDEEQTQRFKKEDYPALPSTVQFGYDSDLQTTTMMGQMLEIDDMSRLPVVALADTFGRVVYLSTGYNTTLGEQLRVIIDVLEKKKNSE